MASLQTGPKKDPGNFRDTINEVARTRGSAVTVFGDFCKMVACALAPRDASGLSIREAEYMETIKGYNKAELDSFAKAMARLITEMEQKPFQDVLGPYYVENASKSTVEARGEFYTPHAVSSLIASMTINPEEVIARGEPITLSDPCVGSGGMILAAAELFAPSKAVDLLRVTAIDISPLACDMTCINTTCWGIPAAVTWGNALTLEEKRTWKNIHWYRVGEDDRQALLKMRDVLNGAFIEEATPERTPAPREADFIIPPPEQRHQGELDFDFFDSLT